MARRRNNDADDEGWVDVRGDGNLLKKVLQEGTGEETAPEGMAVTVDYTGTLEDGTVFDSSRKRGTPFTFNLGAREVILGWDYGVATMKKGERALLKCSPDFAYGRHGAGNVIPPNATLTFDVELHSWGEAKGGSQLGGIVFAIGVAFMFFAALQWLQG